MDFSEKTPKTPPLFQKTPFSEPELILDERPSVSAGAAGAVSLLGACNRFEIQTIPSRLLSGLVRD